MFGGVLGDAERRGALSEDDGVWNGSVASRRVGERCAGVLEPSTLGTAPSLAEVEAGNSAAGAGMLSSSKEAGSSGLGTGLPIAARRLRCRCLD